MATIHLTRFPVDENVANLLQTSCGLVSDTANYLDTATSRFNGIWDWETTRDDTTDFCPRQLVIRTCCGPATRNLRNRCNRCCLWYSRRTTDCSQARLAAFTELQCPSVRVLTICSYRIILIISLTVTYRERMLFRNGY